MAKKEKISAEETSITPAPEKSVEPEAKPEERKEEREVRSGPSLAQIVRRILLLLLRLILIMALIIGIAAAAYFGLPLLYERFIRPVEQNTTQLLDLQNELRVLRESRNLNGTQIAELETRLATLEAEQPGQAESIAQLESRVEAVEGAESERNDALAELTYQSGLLRAMELLSRARLFLYQSNFGLARQDVQAARDVLAEMEPTVPDSKREAIESALFRLDLVLRNLPDFPVAASSDLDIAWQILVQGIPISPTATPTLTPTATPTAQATPTPDITSTPTP